MATPKNRDIERAVLPNGVRVVTERMAHVRSVTVGVWIGTGSREESPEQSGLTHFIEHMVFKGTKNRSAEQIARSIDSIGGGLDAFTSKELVSYNVKVLDEHLPEAFDVVCDLVRNPLFDKGDIEKEKESPAEPRQRDQAARLMMDPEGMAISPRRVTLSALRYHSENRRTWSRAGPPEAGDFSQRIQRRTAPRTGTDHSQVSFEGTDRCLPQVPSQVLGEADVRIRDAARRQRYGRGCAPSRQTAGESQCQSESDRTESGVQEFPFDSSAGTSRSKGS